ncbi:uncharacterized protein [Argopecten irradians]|uniref:uncharacterized protein n=1 Tax=Argopecten irradians TaxID=31199 RepID=UPI00371BA59C
MDDRDVMNVMIIGHSFIRRLRDDLTGEWSNLGFDNDSISVHCYGKGGGRLRDIYSCMSDAISTIKPKIVLLQIGGNDIDSRDFENVRDRLARDLISIAQWLREGFSVQQVGIMQLFYRGKTRHITVQDYNHSVDSVNDVVKSMCGSIEGCFYWRHKGLKDAAFDCLCKDGVHLSDKGLRKYKYSVRGAVLWGLTSANREAAKPRDRSV